MDIIGHIKEAAQIARQIDNIELYKQILDLQGEALEMQEQVLAQAKRIRQVEESLAIQIGLTFVEPAYYAEGKDGKPKGVPYCQNCLEGHGKAIHLAYSTMGENEDGVHEIWVCHNCDKPFRLYRDKPKREYNPPRGPTIVGGHMGT